MALVSLFRFAMERKEQKKTSQQILNLKNRHARFITEYVLRKHPKIYADADAFHKQLRVANPNKRDLTKTHEFLTSTTSFTDYRDFYCRKKLKAHNQKTVTTTTTTTTTTMKTIHEDNMLLNIDLLPPEIAQENTTLAQVIPDHVYQDILAEISKDSDLKAIFNDTLSSNVEDEQSVDRMVEKSLEQMPLEAELDSLC